jgi:hypothetical protein
VTTFIRTVVFLAFGLLLVVLCEILNARLGWSIDLAWVLVVSAAFLWPSEAAPIGGLLFGLVLDGLTGAGSLVYAVSYGGMGLLILLVRRAFYLKGFVASWITALVGAEFLWLLIGLFSQANVLLGGAARFSGWFSPFAISSAVLYPIIYFGASRLLRQPSEPPRTTYYVTSSRNVVR